jgi:hypothetical protein
MFRTVIAAVLALAVVGVFDAPSAQSAESNSPGGPDLKTTLEKGLRARRPVEFAFIQQVVNKVDDGTLSSSLVNSTFLWARQRQPFPFPYFQQALKVRAKKAGVAL